MHFQDIISTQPVLGRSGVSVAAAHDTEKGAARSPHTVLRAIGPEPRCVAYRTPSPHRRRYGDNPNRAQHYFQYQVLIKPSPDSIQETYLSSLRRCIDRWRYSVCRGQLGVHPRCLGCGLGSVAGWHGGHQFTYFRQCGGIDCKPIPVRSLWPQRLACISKALKSWDLSWNGERSCGEIGCHLKRASATSTSRPQSRAAQAVVRHL